jgi:hypothetical protein
MAGENQKAHGVSRELTSWALSGIEPIFSASLLPAWARLGPFGTCDPGDRVHVLTVDRDSSRRDRSPNRAAERFPDWTAVGFRCSCVQTRTIPSPVPRIACVSPAVTGWITQAGLDMSVIEGLSPRGPTYH